MRTVNLIAGGCLAWCLAVPSIAADPRGPYTLKPVLRLYYDCARTTSSLVDNDYTDGVAYLRFGLKGKMPHDLAYNLQFDGRDFVHQRGNLALRYAALQWKPTTDFDLTLGQMEEPFGFEAYGSIKHTVFIDRALPFALTPYYHFGLLAFKRIGPVSTQLGVFGDTIGAGPSDDGQGAAARVFWQPELPEGGTLHFGLSGSVRRPGSNTARIRPRPESQIVPFRFTDTGPIPGVREIGALGLEALWLNGPNTVFAEYMVCRLARSSRESCVFTSGSLSVARFLTRERKNFDKLNGLFTDLTPPGASGAWEIAARVSMIDLDSGEVAGGIETNFTVGLNWYVSKHWRLMLNHISIRSEQNNIRQHHQILQTRIQFDL